MVRIQRVTGNRAPLGNVVPLGKASWSSPLGQFCKMGFGCCWRSRAECYANGSRCGWRSRGKCGWCRVENQRGMQDGWCWSGSRATCYERALRFLPGQRVPRMSGGNDVKVGIGLDKRRFHNHNSVKEAPVLRLSDAREGVEIKPNRR